MKKLVAYFSASGVTKSLAIRLANSINADLFEIEPEKKYSKEDLDWTNPKSRSSLEMKDKSSRPKIKNDIKNISEYDIIFVGFPIWWYIAPTIINSFLENYDLKNKIIVPFATSGGSEMGKTNIFLQNSCLGAKLMNGKRFSSNADTKELTKWANDFIK